MAIKKRKEMDVSLDKLIARLGLVKGGRLDHEALRAQILAIVPWVVSAAGKRYAKRHVKRWERQVRGFVSELPAMASDFARQEAHTPSSTKMVTLQSLAVDLSALTSSVNSWQEFFRAATRKLQDLQGQVDALQREVKSLKAKEHARKRDEEDERVSRMPVGMSPPSQFEDPPLSRKK